MMLSSLRTSVLLSLLVTGCSTSGCGSTMSNQPAAPAVEPEAHPAPSSAPRAPQAPSAPAAAVDLQGGTVEAEAPPAGLAVATFAGGCFWCMEAAFEHQAGVRDAISGYTGGSELHPGYEQVSNHGTSHAEAIRVLYDPRAVTYEQLLELYWHRVDPVHPDQAFVDVGHQYRSVIFVHSPEQRAAAERSRAAIVASNRFHAPVVTTIEDATVFWVAEGYHQNFWRTTPDRYEGYHEHSGRREFLRGIWGPDAPY
jgi:methionine-S-sulfoxide reductase